ncbi:hypothetical protein [Pricia sp.]|uniref:hypothetical protein n=1 Tax=Pricia sp. TaxID=2268138 RepID=UPI0035947FDF
MRKSALVAAFLFSIGLLSAQENTDIVGEVSVLTLGTVSASGYEHIDFPRKNFIIKRGAIANFNALEGEKVVVEEVRSENGATEVVLQRKDGRNFFRFWHTVEADFEKALAKGELILTVYKKEESLAK